MWSYGGEKTQGFDEFSTNFVKRYKSLLEKDAVDFVMQFQDSNHTSGVCNASFVT